MANMTSINEFDIVFISYDEPNADENYADLLEKCPWAKRSHGVYGSDAAHKAAAEMAETDRFITVDADNIVHADFFNIEVDMSKISNVDVISWAGKNHINNLVYGNGGIKCWPKSVVMNMRTHENAPSNDPRAQVDFCWNINYVQMNNVYSNVMNNGSPLQAWRAGFREGVKMVLDRGACPSVDDFKERAATRNLNNLTIWHNVGLDVENGAWAIYGARLGTYMTMLTEWDYKNVMWFDNFPKLWNEHKDYNPLEQAEELGLSLRAKLGLPVCTLSPEQSKFFKRHYNADKHNLGPLVREMDVIRRIEGW